MSSFRPAVCWRSAIRYPGIVGTVAFAFYVIWNICWLTRGVIPPSILIGVFGVPAPTTGMTRSTLAILEGNWGAAFQWNPMTLPFYLVLVWTGVEGVCKLAKKRPFVLSAALVVTWASILLVAWIAKFALGPKWW